MKHLSLLFCATLLAVAAPVPSARADISVSIDFFYDALDPYGDWIYSPSYGYVWQPTLSQRYDDWAPYADGYWAYTDAGWTWISNEDFGWATYHYGRWIRMHGHWVWVPGYEWAPAWVSWRQTDDHIGWAPLPPEARWTVSIGFNWWTDSYYDIGPTYYSFVPIRSFATRSSLRPFIVDRSRNVTYVNRSVNITNITYRQDVVNNIFVGGPDPSRIDRFGGSPVRRLTLRRDEDAFRRDWLNGRGERPRGFGSLSRIDRDQLIVAAPTVKRENVPGLPSRVRESYAHSDIDRGWRNLSDPNAAGHLRERHNQELAKARAEKMPEKTPLILTGKAPPPAVGRLLKPEERRGLVQRPDPGRVDEEVRKAMPQKPEAPRKVIDQPPQLGEARTPGIPDRGDRPAQGRPVMPREEEQRRPNLPGRPAVLPQNPTRVLPGRPAPFTPAARPDLPRSNGPSEGRRVTPPDSNPSPQPKMRPVPMPEPRPEQRFRPAPAPRPEIPRVNPAPMPRPQARPVPEKRPDAARPMPSRPMPQMNKPGAPSEASPRGEPGKRQRP